MAAFLCGRRLSSSSEEGASSTEQVDFESLRVKDEKQQEKALFKAIEEKNFDQIRSLLNNVELTNKKGKKSVLHAFAETCFDSNEEEDVKDIFQLFLDKGCEVDAVDKFGNTPLKFASEKGNVTVIELLIEKKADVNAKDEFSQDSPLHWAAKKGKIEAVHVLITKGSAAVNIQNKDLKTPLHYAVEQGKKSTVVLLLYHRADANLKDKDKESPLSYAERKDDREMENILKTKRKGNFEDEASLIDFSKRTYPDIIDLFTQQDVQVVHTAPEGCGEQVQADSTSGKAVTNVYNYHINLHDNASAAIGDGAQLTNNNPSRPIASQPPYPFASPSAPLSTDSDSSSS